MSVSSNSLKIASGLTLPLETVTQTIGVLAKRRAGKSYCARRIAEQLFKAGQQIIITDPKGDWHGIRSSSDGKGPGLPVIILGGEHGDIPLEASSGEIVAKLAVEERVSILLDLSVFRKHEVATFMTAFLENLYRLKAKEVNRTPVMLIIDEADAIAPQKPQKGEERMLGAAEDIVRRGGQRGIGCTLVTQRSAVLNKNVLTQVGVLVALRTIAPQDLDAMKAWIDVHGTLDQQHTLMGSLPSLPIGDAWFWAPGWPDEDGIFKRVHVLPIETFDSGATPKPGEKRIEPKRAADIDMEALRRSMAETVKRAEANDPKRLKQRIAELERDLSSAGKAKGLSADSQERLAKIEAERNHWKAISAAAERARDKMVSRFETLKNAVLPKLGAVTESLQSLSRDIIGESFELNNLKTSVPEPVQRVIPANKPPQALTQPRPSRNAAIMPTDLPEGITGPHKKILDALARLEAVGQTTPRIPVVSALAGYSHGGGAWNNYKARLNAAGMIVLRDGYMALTDTGRRIASYPDQPVTLDDLHDAWLQLFPTPVRKMLVVIIKMSPHSLSKEQLGEKAGYAPTGGAFNNYLSRLRASGAVVNDGPGHIKASELLFPEGLA